MYSYSCYDAYRLQWSQKSWPLHAKGLGKVLKWLQQIRSNWTEVETGQPPHLLWRLLVYICSCFIYTTFGIVNCNQVLSSKQLEYCYSPPAGNITVC